MGTAARPIAARLRPLACVALVAFGAGAAAQATGALDGIERETLKARFDVRGADRPDELAVVGIDAKSFDVLREQWPFPRSLHADAVRSLHAAGAAEIVYDVQFTEPTVPREDLALYDAIDAAGGAVLATSEVDRRGRTNVLGGDENLRRIGARAGASDLTNDGTVAVVRFPHDIRGLPTLPIVAARRAGATELEASAFDGGGAWIDYRGPPGTIETLSFGDVVRGRFDDDAVQGRIVVVGASAPTLRDVHATPVGGDEPMAGPEVQANAIWTALHGAPLRSVPEGIGLLLVAVLSLLAPLAGLRLPAWLVGVTTVAAAVLFAVGAQLAFEGGWIVEVAPLLAALLVAAVGTIAWSQLAESQARLAVTRDNEVLEARVRERTRELWNTQVEILQRLGNAVDWRDAETGLHIERIGRSCERLALAIGMPPHDAEQLRYASALHDVGKLGIPDEVLAKPGPLSPGEWELMKTHTTIGGEILEGSSSELVELSRVIALTHHEHWNGGGYPLGLRGEEIPLPGRICAICDVFDALLSTRPYKDPWPFDRALAEIERLSGTQFDPGLVRAFLPIASELDPAEAEQAEALAAR
jgi:CHASE2 domain-containing sensor protein